MTIPSRELNMLHILFDIIFLAGLVILLLAKKRYMTLLFGIAGGILYFIVDWGIFYRLMGARVINYGGEEMAESGKFFFLFWMSMSYGLTNFAWIWLWLKKDKHLKEFSIYILAGWLAVAVSATDVGKSLTPISIYRTTGLFHSVMAAFLIVSYGAVIVYNLFNKKGAKLPIIWMLAIGVLVQFGWEAALLLGNVRSVGYSGMETIKTIIVNSLIETNPGIPVIFLIQAVVLRWRGEDLSLNKNFELNKSPSFFELTDDLCGETNLCPEAYDEATPCPENN